MPRLTDKQRKMILADLSMGETVRTLSAKYHVSTTTIQRVKNYSSKEIKQQIEEKNKENVKSVLAYMDAQKDEVCTLIGKLMAALNDPQKIAETPLHRIATTLGIIIDKYSANEVAPTDPRIENNLFEQIHVLAEVKINYDEIPELAEQIQDVRHD